MKKPYSPAEEPSEGGAKWLTTFNDLMTLLLVFFVLLFTMGSVDAMKLKNFKSSLQGGLGVMFEGKTLSVGVVDPVVRMTHEDQHREKNYEKRLDQALEDTDTGKGAGSEGGGFGTGGEEGRSEADLDLQQTVDRLTSVSGARVSASGEGVVVTLDDCVLFDLGDAEINPAGFPLLDRISTVLSKTTVPVRVEGHTDNLPIRSLRYPSNWELSTARAVNVLKYMVEIGDIAPQRLSAAGYGASKPLLPNDSPEHRAKNRRVELVLVTEEGCSSCPRN